MNFATEQDYEKLRRIVRWILGSIDELAFLGAIDNCIMLNFIDASYKVHQHFTSHTGAEYNLGWGVFSSMSSKKKLNTNRSTNSESFGVVDCMQKVSYFLLFLDAKVVQLKKNVILQDNNFATLAEKLLRHHEAKYLDT